MPSVNELLDAFTASIKLSAVKSVDLLARMLDSEIKLRAPLGKTGNLYKSISYRVNPDRARATVRVSAPHAHLVEYGHELVTEKGGPTVGIVPPHPFVRPAIDAVRKQMAETVAEQVRQAEAEAQRTMDNMNVEAA